MQTVSTIAKVGLSIVLPDGKDVDNNVDEEDEVGDKGGDGGDCDQEEDDCVASGVFVLQTGEGADGHAHYRHRHEDGGQHLVQTLKEKNKAHMEELSDIMKI